MQKFWISANSPAKNQVDLELWYKVFFFTDSCKFDIAIEDSGWWQPVIIEHFEKFKMASKMSENEYRHFCGGSFCFMFWCIKFLCCWRLMYVFIFLVKVTEWPPIGKIAAHSAYDMFHGISTWLLVWFFPTSVFGVGIFFWLRLFLIFAYLYLFTIIQYAP